MIPPRVRLAVWAAAVGHGLFIITARYHLSYDAYTHMFFGDHYARDWWALWEPRWFGGFEVVTYPPLVHQLIALIGGIVGIDAAYGILAWLVLSAYPLAVYAFCRAFYGRTVSGYAAIAAAVLPSIYYCAHVFGQLPTLTATLFALFGFGALAEYLKTGSRLAGALAVALLTTTIAAHHATLLFLPWGITALTLHLILNGRAAPTLIPRLMVFALLSALSGLAVIWPFWAWGAGQSIQTPIDHASRHNFFADPFAINAFFLPMYGPLLIIFPVAAVLATRRRYTGLFVAFCFLFLLGLGGTTPLPKLFFGTSWEWLTYDRFAFWASLVLLPYFGAALVLARRRLPGWISFSGQVSVARMARRYQLERRINLRTWLRRSTLAVFAAVALFAGLIPTLLQTQPRQLDLIPIVEFLGQEGRSGWRYLTFGFGDQLANLSRLTNSSTMDGSYFTARTIPELRTSGIGQIDTVLWSQRGIRALDPILDRASEWGIRWGFVNHRDYVRSLINHGWVFVQFLPNGVQVWENPLATPPLLAAPPTNRLASFSWGVLPLLSLCITAALAGLRLRPARTSDVLLGIQTICVGLLPLSLVFWYFRQLTAIEYPLVYFVYDNALFFLSDALAVLASLAWLLRRWFAPYAVGRPHANDTSLHWPFGSPMPWFFGICVLASLSVIWSADWRISLIVSLHLWLAFAFFMSIRSQPSLWRPFALGAFTALLLQIFFGFWQFFAQTTSMLAPLRMQWPGSLLPAVRGVSVVQHFDGTRLLRAYGSLAHPNILGTLIVALLPAILLLYVKSQKLNLWLIGLIGLTGALLVMTFSRAAWIGLLVTALLLAARGYLLDRRRVLLAAAAATIGVLAAAIPVRDYILIRVTNAPVPTEIGSWYPRLWLIERSLLVSAQHPVLGVGIGTEAMVASRGIALDEFGPAGSFTIEPVHAVPLLAMSELGPIGALLLAGLCAAVGWSYLKARRIETVMLAAGLLGLFSVQLFDHFLWTLFPGRILFAAVLGVWAAQAREESGGLTTKAQRH